MYKKAEFGEAMDIDSGFEAALLEVGKLEAHKYFVYGSSAMAAREAKPEIARKKVRFKNIPPIRDIDVAVHSSIDWDTVVSLSQAVLISSNGEVCLDVHRLRIEGDVCHVKDTQVPLSWFTTSEITYGSAKIDVLDPIPSLMLRLLHIAHDNLRPKDTLITIKELKLLKSTAELRDERILFGFNYLIKHAKPGKLLLTGPARVILGFLPQDLLDKIRIQYRKTFTDNLIGEIPIRYQPEDI